MEESLTTAQKILSCIVRLNEGFGGDYTASVLIGSHEQRILANCHEKLSTYGILSDYTKRVVRDWIEQLAAQGCIRKTEEYSVLQVTNNGWRVLKGKDTPRLLRPAKKPAKPPKAAKDSWEAVDRELFEVLRKLRRKIALDKGVPAYIVFGDVTLRDMARRKPLTPEDFLKVNGVGDKKCEEYGALFLAAIKEYSRGT